MVPKKAEAKARIIKLKKVISAERYNVHVLDRSTMSEAALDSLKKELFDLEQQYPELITADSPTQRVAGKPLAAFKKVKHPQKVLSLNDAFSEQDLRDWEKRLGKVLAGKEFKYFCELKIDGLDIILKYQDGIFVNGATRGNGIIGEDVTQNLKTIEAIPLHLDQETFYKKFKQKLPATIYVQGEIYLPIKEFERINREQQKTGANIYANPRNTAAGSIRQLDPKITANRKLSVFVFNILTDLGQKTHADIHEMAIRLGFRTEPNSQLAADLRQVEKYLKKWDQTRKKLPYQTDGAVVQVNSTQDFKDLGVVGKAPRGAIAYKFPAEEATTKVSEIQISVGRTGSLTPIAVMQPVKIAGTTVSRASLHNADEVKRLDVRVGDTVIIRKAGDIIPEVVRVLKKLRTGKEKVFKMPSKCPMCGGPVLRKKGEVAHYCANPKCFAIDREKVVHFVGKSGLDIEFVGPKLIDKLFEAELINDPADLFELKAGDLAILEGFKEKAIQRVIDSLARAKQVDFNRLIFALGIRHIGSETAQDLARLTTTLWSKKHKGKPTLKDMFMFLPTLSRQDWSNVQGIGQVVAESLYQYFSAKSNQKFLNKLVQAQLEIKIPAKLKTKLAHKTFVITGTLDSMSREIAKQKIINLGGSVASSLSKNTDYLIVGANPGSKLKKAQELKIKTLSETEFINLLK